MTALRATVQALPAPGQPPCGSSSLLSYICLRKHSETQTSTKQLPPPRTLSVLYFDPLRRAKGLGLDPWKIKAQSPPAPLFIIFVV